MNYSHLGQWRLDWYYFSVNTSLECYAEKHRANTPIFRGKRFCYFDLPVGNATRTTMVPGIDLHTQIS